MARIRVHQLARELNVESRTLLAWLREHGEFVRSASSLLETHVERKVRAEFDPKVAPGAPARQAETSPKMMRSMRLPRPGTNPFTGTGGASTPRHAQRPGPKRPAVSDSVRAEVEAIFGSDAARQALGSGGGSDDVLDDGFYRNWQTRLIDRETYEAFKRNGLRPHEDCLAEECLLANLKPEDLLWRVGDRTVIEWIRGGSPVATIAKTLHDCRSNPADAHLISPPAPR